MIEIQDSKEVWVSWTNTDCTEGRGYQVPKVVCEKEATAIRLGRKGYVQGTDCPISKMLAVKVSNQWLVPGTIEAESNDDAEKQALIDEKRLAVEKAKTLGLSDDDIAALKR